MRPVVVSPELIEGHITENRMAMLIIDHRDVARDTVIRRLEAGCRRPVHSTVDRIGDMRIVLISCAYLPRVVGVNADGRFREKSWVRSQIHDFSGRCPSQIMALC